MENCWSLGMDKDDGSLVLVWKLPPLKSLRLIVSIILIPKVEYVSWSDVLQLKLSCFLPFIMQ